jgi:hypothetical protein
VPDRFPQDLSRQLSQLVFCLLQPEPHIHLAVHGRRRGEVLLRLRMLTHVQVELPEAAVAVRDEGGACADQMERMGREPGLMRRGLDGLVA